MVHSNNYVPRRVGRHARPAETALEPEYLERRGGAAVEELTFGVLQFHRRRRKQTFDLALSSASR